MIQIAPYSPHGFPFLPIVNTNLSLLPHSANTNKNMFQQAL